MLQLSLSERGNKSPPKKAYTLYAQNIRSQTRDINVTTGTASASPGSPAAVRIAPVPQPDTNFHFGAGPSGGDETIRPRGN